MRLENEYQIKLLKALVQPHFLRENIKYLSADIFDDLVDKHIASVIIAYWQVYKETPPIDDLCNILSKTTITSVKEEIPLVCNRAKGLYITEAMSGLAYLGEQVREFAGQQRLKNIALTIGESLQQGDNVDDVAKSIYSSLSFIQRDTCEVMSLNSATSLDEWVDYRKNIGKYRTSTGYPKLDERIDGGIGHGELFLILVGNKGGKSTFLINLATNMIEQGLNGVYVTLELGRLKIYERFLMRLNKTHNQKLAEQAIASEQVRALIKDNVAKLGRLDIISYPSWTASVADIESKILSLDFQIDFICVDYIMEIRPVQADNRREAIATVGRALRGMGGRLGFPVLTAHQANRESKKRMASSGGDTKKLIEGSIDVSECYELIGVADIIGTINQDQEDFDSGLLRFWLSESRVGTSKGKPILFNVDFSTQTIVELDIDIDENMEYIQSSEEVRI